MSKLLDRAVRLALALMVAGGLGFGAQAAYAGTQSSACPTDLPNGRIPVSCTTDRSCDGPCNSYFGAGSEGGCLQGCCVCAV